MSDKLRVRGVGRQGGARNFNNCGEKQNKKGDERLALDVDVRDR